MPNRNAAAKRKPSQGHRETKATAPVHNFSLVVLRRAGCLPLGESEGPAEKYRAAIDGETQDEPVSQRWGRSSLNYGDEGDLIHPTYTKVFAGGTVRKNNDVTSGELPESPGGTGVSGPISESEVASDALSVVGRLNSTDEAW